MKQIVAEILHSGDNSIMSALYWLVLAVMTMSTGFSIGYALPL